MEYYNCIHLPVSKYGYYDISDAPPTINSYLEGLRANILLEAKTNILEVATASSEGLGDFFAIALSKISSQLDEHGRSGLAYYHILLIKKHAQNVDKIRKLRSALYENKYHKNIDNEIELIINIAINQEFSKAKEFIRSHYITERDILSVDSEPESAIQTEAGNPSDLHTFEPSAPTQASPPVEPSTIDLSPLPGASTTELSPPSEPSRIESGQSSEPRTTELDLPSKPSRTEPSPLDEQRTTEASPPSVSRITGLRLLSESSQTQPPEPEAANETVLIGADGLTRRPASIAAEFSQRNYDLRIYKELRKLNYLLILVLFLMLFLLASILLLHQWR